MPWAVERDDGSFAPGQSHPGAVELKDRLGLKTVPEEEKGRYQTLSGMLMLLTGKLPSVTDKVVWESLGSLRWWTWMARSVDKILATKVEVPIDLSDEA